MQRSNKGKKINNKNIIYKNIIKNLKSRRNKNHKFLNFIFLGLRQMAVSAQNETCI